MKNETHLNHLHEFLNFHVKLLPWKNEDFFIISELSAYEF